MHQYVHKEISDCSHVQYAGLWHKINDNLQPYEINDLLHNTNQEQKSFKYHTLVQEHNVTTLRIKQRNLSLVTVNYRDRTRQILGQTSEL